MRTRKIAGLFACAAALLMVCQACYPPGTPKKVKEEFIAALEKEERPIKLSLRMVDQYGAGAKNYRFKISLTRLHSIFWHKYSRDECTYLTTDDQGYVHLERPGQKASSLAFKECDIDQYVFSKELEKNNWWSMPILTDVQTPVEFKVIRHGPPVRLVKFSTQRHDYVARDENSFALDIHTGKAEEAGHGGDFVVRVLNAQEMGEANVRDLRATTENRRKGIYAQPPFTPVNWSVSMTASGVLAFQETKDEHLSYAPSVGYVKNLVWNNTLTRNQGPGMGAHLYAKDEETGQFYWLTLGVGVDVTGKLTVYIDGLTNPDKSSNLYQEKWPHKDEFKRYSERCP